MKSVLILLVFLTGCAGFRAASPERQRVECLRLDPGHPWMKSCERLIGGKI